MRYLYICTNGFIGESDIPPSGRDLNAVSEGNLVVLVKEGGTFKNAVTGTRVAESVFVTGRPGPFHAVSEHTEDRMGRILRVANA